jgi:hypothetical protein
MLSGLLDISKWPQIAARIYERSKIIGMAFSFNCS